MKKSLPFLWSLPLLTVALFSWAVSRPVFAPLSFIDFETARQALLQQAPCKWISSQPNWGDTQPYDMLCTGGTWGTITLLLDKTGPEDDALGRVRLLWRSWDPQVHPAAADVPIARRFLSFVIHQFVPRRFAKEVERTFWQNTSQTWAGQVAHVSYQTLEGDGYLLHKLEITAPKPQKTSSGGFLSRLFSTEKEGSRPLPSRRHIVVDRPTIGHPMPRSQAESVAQPVPTSENSISVKEIKQDYLTVRESAAHVEINGLSHGRAMLNSLQLVDKLSDDGILRTSESLLYVTPPQTGEEAYQQAEELTKSVSQHVEKEGDTLLEKSQDIFLSPQSVAPAVTAPEPPHTRENLTKESFERTLKGEKQSQQQDLRDLLPAHHTIPDVPAAQPLQERIEKEKEYEDTDQQL